MSCRFYCLVESFLAPNLPWSKSNHSEDTERPGNCCMADQSVFIDAPRPLGVNAAPSPQSSRALAALAALHQHAAYPSLPPCGGPYVATYLSTLVRHSGATCICSLKLYAASSIDRHLAFLVALSLAQCLASIPSPLPLGPNPGVHQSQV